MQIYPNKTFNVKKAIDAHLRNSIIIAHYLGAELLMVEDDYLRAIKKKYDVLIMTYASFYAPFNLIKKMVQNNPDALHVLFANEYNQTSNIAPFTPPFLYIANFETPAITKKNILEFHCLNLNLLLSKNANQLSTKKYDCIYYGTFRPNRAKYLEEYIHSPIYLSTSDKNFKKYKHVGCNPRWIKKLTWQPRKETLNQFKYSLYLEDDYTHDVFNNLANRWYEAGFSNVVMFFDVNTWNTIRKSEIGYFENQIKDYIVSSHDELIKKIEYCNENFEKHLAVQKSWRLQEPLLKKQLLENIRNIIYNYSKQST